MAGEADHNPSVSTDRPAQEARAAQAEVDAMISAAASGSASTDLDLLLQKAEDAIASLDEPSADLPLGVRPFDLEEFAGTPANLDGATLELVRDVELDLKIELGRTDMHLEDVLRLKRGSVVTLDKLAGDPVDVIVNGRLVARGEVLVLNDNFCVRVTELIVGESVVD